MLMKQKNIFYLLVVLAIIAIAAFIVYQFVYRGGSGTGATGTLPGQTSGSLPSVTNQQFPSGGSSTAALFNTSGASTASSSSKFGIVSNDPALDYFVDAANTVTLIKPDGAIESISNNATVALSYFTVSNIITTKFSYDGKKVLLSYQAGTTTRTSVFDISSKTWSHLPDGMLSPVWSPVDYRVSYLTPSNTGSETISTIDASTTNANPFVITSLAMENSSLQWPAKDTLIISDRPSAFVAGSIWSFNIPSKTLSAITYNSLGAEGIGSASGSILLFSAGPKNSGGSLLFLNGSGDQEALSFKTLPSKCVFGPTAASGTANLFYCAIPSDQDTFSVARLPDEYDQKIYFTSDDFYSVDSDTGAYSQIFSSAKAGQSLDATNMRVLNNVLFFINRYDEKVYAISLQH